MWSKMISVSKRSACASMRCINSGPCTPSASPGQLSTSVVDGQLTSLLYTGDDRGFEVGPGCVDGSSVTCGPEPTINRPWCLISLMYNCSINLAAACPFEMADTGNLRIDPGVATCFHFEAGKYRFKRNILTDRGLRGFYDSA